MKKTKGNWFILIIAVIFIAAIAFMYHFYMKLQSNTNNTTQSTALNAPVFSMESGFYKDSISIKIKSKMKNGTIYYTLDGSKPTAQSIKYTGAISVTDKSSDPNVLSAETGISGFGDFTPSEPVEKGTIIRAVAIDKSGNTSAITTNSYFIGQDFIDKYSDIPVVSLVMPQDSLFDYNVGIYKLGYSYDYWVASGGDPDKTDSWEWVTNYTQEGKDWERAVHMDFFNSSKDGLGISQDMGIRISGGASAFMEQKSLKLFARSEYGNSKLNYTLIPDNTSNTDENSVISDYDSFILRNGGNDAYLGKFRDAYIQSLVSNRNFTTQDSQPVIVFLDGEYWGIYTLQEDYSEQYLQDNYGINNDNAVIFKRGTIDTGSYEDQPLYNEWIDCMNNSDLSTDEGYKEISSLIDIQSLIDYFSTEIYINNEDWLNYNNNYCMWRSRTASDNAYEDGKWRYMMYDVEYSCGLYTEGTSYDTDSLSAAMTMPDWENNQIKLFSSLLKNKTFKQQFVTTFMDMANTNFAPEAASEILDTVSSKYRPFISDYYDRFGPQWILDATDDTTSYFDTNVEQVRTFIKNRYDYVPDMLKKDLNLTGDAVELTIETNDANGGTIEINTTTADISSGSWIGKYFTDYPVTLTAKPAKGYKFTGWSGLDNSSDETISVSIIKASTITATFEKD